MISRTSFVTVCLVLVVAASLSIGAYSGVSTDGSTASASLAQESDPYTEECLSTSGLENVSMNAYRQEATALRTQSANVSSTGNGTTAEEGLIGIESGYIEGNETCFDRISTENETMQIALEEVQFENTTLRGPWTNIEFGEGEADSMTVVLPGDAFLSVLRQMHVGDSFIDLFKDIYDLSSADDGDHPGAGDDEPPGDSDGPADNATDPDDSAPRRPCG
ncbi:hypothetical protein [Natrinema salaciae]|uniref:Uncharacterized protein n=1 Tax=Natrinema salaciae TaxID=1186196 RepID=A0A1H9M5T5_9EURY|nr:hypothetical protein [Natrinema salaciae]SER19058.1 hypothetical protein SAMN04489841_3216 [Natrinema salaciae]